MRQRAIASRQLRTKIHSIAATRRGPISLDSAWRSTAFIYIHLAKFLLWHSPIQAFSEQEHDLVSVGGRLERLIELAIIIAATTATSYVNTCYLLSVIYFFGHVIRLRAFCVSLLAKKESSILVRCVFMCIFILGLETKLKLRQLL